MIAKGIRKIKSRRAPHLELFNEVEVMIHHGKTFPVVTEARILESYSHLKSDLKLSGYLFYLSEVLDRILPENQPHEELYQSLLATLQTLSSVADKDYEKAEEQVKQFVIRLLWNLGYLPKGQYPQFGVTSSIEEVIEKPIKSKKFLEEL